MEVAVEPGDHWPVRVLSILLLGACYAPNPSPGSPCVDDSQCPSALVCSPLTMTCEHDRQTAAADAPLTDSPVILIDGCVPAAEACGDGVDQDCDGGDLACAANDVPGGAIDVTAGGSFTGDALLARDDVDANGCGSAGGRDLFFRVNLTAPQVYYFDTLGSSFNTVVRVYTKPCAQVGTGAGAAACGNDACGGSQSQLAARLPSGESCVVVDQSDASQSGALMLRVMKGGRDGLVLATGTQTTNGDTTNATNLKDPIDMCDAPGSGGRDVAYFFPVCPGTSMLLDADICPEPNWDPVLYVSRVDNNQQLACRDDDCGAGPHLTNITLNNGRLFVLYVDGFDPSYHGAFTMHSNIR